MKTTVLAICMVLMASFAGAVDVTQIIFDGYSVAVPSAANIRITPLSATMLKDTSKTVIQTFVWRAGLTENFTATKTKTYTLGTAIGAWIQVDQATHLRLNSESAYMVLPSGFSDVILFE